MYANLVGCCLRSEGLLMDAGILVGRRTVGAECGGIIHFHVPFLVSAEPEQVRLCVRLIENVLS